MKLKTTHQCTLCSAPMLGERNTQSSAEPAWNVCFMCVLAAEEAVEALEGGFRLGPRPPDETHGGRFCVKQRPSAIADAVDGAACVPTQYETLFRPTDDLPTRWF